MNDYQKELISNLKKYLAQNVEPHMEEDDEKSFFRMNIFKSLGEMGILGISMEEKWGGSELGYKDFCLALEEIAKVSVSYAVTVSVSGMVQSIIAQFGSDHQKSKYLPSLIQGDEIGAFALSESGTGSDAGSLKTSAKKVDGGYILNGNKMWITSGGIAKTYIVIARTSPDRTKGLSAFIVRDGTAGFSYGKAEKKMGWKISPTRELIFENCFIPDENLLQTEGVGFKIAMSGLDKGRTTIGSIGVGLAAQALEESVKYALEREQFSQPIFDFQGLQFMMAEMATEVEASRLLVYESARLIDQGTPNSKLSSMCKLKATDTAMKVTTDAVQILGGVGYTTEYPVERMMRDAKVLQIVEGTNQIQRVVIARELKREFSK